MCKVWLITGCSRGLGRELAQAVLAAGHRLVATARDLRALDVLLPSDRLRIAPLDVTDPAAARAAVAVALSAFGRLDVLVNNADLCPARHLFHPALRRGNPCRLNRRRFGGGAKCEQDDDTTIFVDLTRIEAVEHHVTTVVFDHRGKVKERALHRDRADQSGGELARISEESSNRGSQVRAAVDDCTRRDDPSCRREARVDQAGAGRYVVLLPCGDVVLRGHLGRTRHALSLCIRQVGAREILHVQARTFVGGGESARAGYRGVLACR